MTANIDNKELDRKVARLENQCNELKVKYDKLGGQLTDLKLAQSLSPPRKAAVRLDWVLIAAAICITAIFISSVALESVFLTIVAVVMSLVWLFLLAEWD